MLAMMNSPAHSAVLGRVEESQPIAADVRRINYTADRIAGRYAAVWRAAR